MLGASLLCRMAREPQAEPNNILQNVGEAETSWGKVQHLGPE